MKKFIIFLLILGVSFSIYFNVIEENEQPSGNYNDNSYNDAYNDAYNNSYDDSYNNNQTSESFRDTVQSGHDLFNSLMKDNNSSSSNQQTNTNTNNNNNNASGNRFDNNSSSNNSQDKGGVAIVQIGDKSNSGSNTAKPNTSTNTTKPNTNTTKPNTNTNTNTNTNANTNTNTNTNTNANTNNNYSLNVIFNPYTGKVSGTSNDMVKLRVSKNKDNIINSVSRNDEVLNLAAQAISAYKNENSNAFRNLVTEHIRRDSYNLSGYAEKFKYCNAIEYTIVSDGLLESANKGMRILYGDGYVVTEAVNMTFDITNENSHNRKYWFITFYKMNGKWGLQSWGDAI